MEEIVEEKGTDLTLCSPVLANLSKIRHYAQLRAQHAVLCPVRNAA